VHGSAVNATSEREWLLKLIDACNRALQDLRDKPAPENQALEEDLERFSAELEERLRLLRTDEA
jgi:molecular chaperone GrpE (heat shock protein)